MQFGTNKQLSIFQRQQIALTRCRCKIYSCLLTPNSTWHHVITYTNTTYLCGKCQAKRNVKVWNTNRLWLIELLQGLNSTHFDLPLINNSNNYNNNGSDNHQDLTIYSTSMNKLFVQCFQVQLEFEIQHIGISSQS